MAAVNGVCGGGGGAMVMNEQSDESKRGAHMAASNGLAGKRKASDTHLNDIERFEKRLRALSIRNEEKRAERNSVPQYHKRGPSRNGVLSTGFKQTPPPAPPPPVGNGHDGMEVDDTRDRVYIADLDAELASDDSSDEDEKLIFLPDIERKFTQLPKQVHVPVQQTPGPQELVLYQDPKSLSVHERYDSVRRAVNEARERAREKTRARQQDMERMYGGPSRTGWGANGFGAGAVETAHGYGDAGYISPLRLDHEQGPDDPDAMDLA